MNRILMLLVVVLLFGLSAACSSKQAKNLDALKTFIETANWRQASDTLIVLLREDPAGTQAPELALLLASVFEQKLKDTEASTSVYQAITEAYGGSDAAKTAATRIPEGAAPLAERIETMQAKVFDPTKVMADPAVLASYLNSCVAHVLLLPQDPRSETLLNKAAENAYYTQQYDRALYLYQWFESAYPASDKAPQALFMRAFIYDNDLKKYEKAGPLYEEFLRKYPEDDFADDAEVLLENLGKSPEEMIQALEGKEVK